MPLSKLLPLPHLRNKHNLYDSPLKKHGSNRKTRIDLINRQIKMMKDCDEIAGQMRQLIVKKKNPNKKEDRLLTPVRFKRRGSATHSRNDAK